MEIYDEEWAANYVRLADAGIPGREGIYRIGKAFFHGLPAAASILVVGCGTGEDLLTLARTYPDARFTGIDPTEAMLAQCAKRVASEGFSDRVSLHHSSLQAFNAATTFDAVSVVLVSQHIADDAEATDFFKKIASLLKPNGRVFSADLHIPFGQNRAQLFELWYAQATLTSANPGLAAEILRHFETDIRPRDEIVIEGFLKAAGFANIIKPFSSLIYGAWGGYKLSQS